MRTLTKLIVTLLLLFSPTLAFADTGLYAKAQRYIGLRETANSKALRNVLGVNPRSTPWCGYFVTHVVSQTGKKAPSGSGKALSWKRYGSGVRPNNAKRGDVVVIRTGRGFHVGILDSIRGGRIYLLGGNQSNSVRVSSYSANKIVAVRR